MGGEVPRHFFTIKPEENYFEVSKTLSSVFNALLPNPIFRKVMPTDYNYLKPLAKKNGYNN